MCHENSISSHTGIKKTLELVTRHYNWPKITRTIQKFIKQCQTCCRNKNSTKNPSGSLTPHPNPSKPFETIAIDFFTDLPISNSFDCILIIIDHFIKYTIYIPVTKTLDASSLADIFIREYFKRFGLPKYIVSNKNKLFTS